MQAAEEKSGKEGKNHPAKKPPPEARGPALREGVSAGKFPPFRPPLGPGNPARQFRLPKGAFLPNRGNRWAQILGNLDRPQTRKGESKYRV